MISAALSGLVGVVVTTLPGLITTLLPAAMGLLQSVLDAIVANVGPLTKLAVDILTQLAGFLTTNVPTLLSAAGDILTGLIDGIIAALPDLIPMAVTMLASLATALVGAIPEITARLPEIVDAIWQGLQAVDWLGLGANLIQGLIDGLNAAVGSLGALIDNVFKGIWQGILDVFGIASPSTEAKSAGDFILKGLVEGFQNAVDGVVTTVKAIFGKIWDAIKSIFGFGGGESDESKESKQAGSDIMTGMRHYYASIRHDLLKKQLRRYIKDARMLLLLDRLIDWYKPGLPLGNYTSQWFANFFLQPMDHYIQEDLYKLRRGVRVGYVCHYLRNMDDMIIVGSSKWDVGKSVRAIIERASSMGLTVKPCWEVKEWTDDRPVDILGFRIGRTYVELRSYIALHGRKRHGDLLYQDARNRAHTA